MRRITSVLNSLIKKGNWYNNERFCDCRKMWNYNIFDTDIVNLGSTSAVYAFDYTGIEKKCANWAISSNPLLGDFEILKNYSSYLSQQGSVVILPLCPFSLLAGSYSLMDDRYYTLLYPSSIPFYSYAKQNRIQNEMRNPLSYYPLISIISDIKYHFKSKKQRIKTEEQLKSNAKERMNGWLNEFSIQDLSLPLSLKNKDSVKDALSLITELKDFCSERNIRMVLVIPPVHYSLGNLLTIEVRKHILVPIYKLAEEKSIEFCNYLDDEEFSHNTSFFVDSFLLNKAGAVTFTKKVITDLCLTV